ncbi:MAG TPA: hypothetical protein VEO37_10900 [Thermoanaerobaculia bacterium]|nr:hypothetical protein [Thermoanaerobaculia bacterium]
MTALIYQVAWMLEMRLVFGFSTAASAAVVAIFMGGLASGAGFSGGGPIRRLGRSPSMESDQQ